MTKTIIPAEEVKKHNTRNSVWMVIRNEVYDVTPFIPEHPGGEDPLYESAGMDATIAFDDVGHSEDARELLKKYHIGTLAPGAGLSPYHYDCVECNASRNWWKYGLVALAAAIIAGVAYKKYAT